MDSRDWGDKGDSDDQWLEGDIFKPDNSEDGGDPGGDPGVYSLRIKSGNVTDFAGEMLIWKSKIEDIRAAGDDINLNYR